MAVRVESLVNYLLNVPEPINHLFEPREVRIYPFIEWDSVVNDERIYDLMQEQRIRVDDLEPNVGLYVSEWDRTPKLRLGGYVYWVDASGNYRQKYGDPTHDTDGIIIGPSAATKNELVIDGLTTAAMAQYQAGYVSANNTLSPTDCSAATGSFQKATFAGVYNGIAGEMVNRGKVEVQFDAGLVPAPTAGEPVHLSWLSLGQFRNDIPAKKSNNFMTYVGIILDASNYAVNQRCVIILQPESPIQRT